MPKKSKSKPKKKGVPRTHPQVRTTSGTDLVVRDTRRGKYKKQKQEGDLRLARNRTGLGGIAGQIQNTPEQVIAREFALAESRRGDFQRQGTRGIYNVREPTLGITNLVGGGLGQDPNQISNYFRLRTELEREQARTGIAEGQLDRPEVKVEDLVERIDIGSLGPEELIKISKKDLISAPVRKKIMVDGVLMDYDKGEDIKRRKNKKEQDYRDLVRSKMDTHLEDDDIDIILSQPALKMYLDELTIKEKPVAQREYERQYGRMDEILPVSKELQDKGVKLSSNDVFSIAEDLSEEKRGMMDKMSHEEKETLRDLAQIRKQEISPSQATKDWWHGQTQTSGTFSGKRIAEVKLLEQLDNLKEMRREIDRDNPQATNIKQQVRNVRMGPEAILERRTHNRKGMEGILKDINPALYQRHYVEKGENHLHHSQFSEQEHKDFNKARELAGKPISTRSQGLRQRNYKQYKPKGIHPDVLKSKVAEQYDVPVKPVKTSTLGGEIVSTEEPPLKSKAGRTKLQTEKDEALRVSRPDKPLSRDELQDIRLELENQLRTEKDKVLTTKAKSRRPSWRLRHNWVDEDFRKAEDDKYEQSLIKVRGHPPKPKPPTGSPKKDKPLSSDELQDIRLKLENQLRAEKRSKTPEPEPEPEPIAEPEPEPSRTASPASSKTLTLPSDSDEDYPQVVAGRKRRGGRTPSGPDPPHPTKEVFKSDSEEEEPRASGVRYYSEIDEEEPKWTKVARERAFISQDETPRYIPPAMEEEYLGVREPPEPNYRQILRQKNREERAERAEKWITDPSKPIKIVAGKVDPIRSGMEIGDPVEEGDKGVDAQGRVIPYRRPRPEMRITPGGELETQEQREDRLKRLEPTIDADEQRRQRNIFLKAQLSADATIKDKDRAETPISTYDATTYNPFRQYKRD